MLLPPPGAVASCGAGRCGNGTATAMPLAAALAMNRLRVVSMTSGSLPGRGQAGALAQCTIPSPFREHPGCARRTTEHLGPLPRGTGCATGADVRLRAWIADFEWEDP